MTTDTYPKLATRKAEIDGVPVAINGFCKGAGMIAPDMATMLSFIFTDAADRTDGNAEPALEACADDVQLHDHRRGYVDQRHLLAVRYRRGGEARPEARRRPGGSAPTRIRRRLAGSHARPRHSGREGRRGSLQVRHLPDRRRRELGGRAHDCAELCQLAAPEISDLRRGPQLGSRGHGHRQSRRGGRPRQALDLVRLAHRRPQRRAGGRIRGDRRLRPT